jgi:hypothetical protein
MKAVKNQFWPRQSSKNEFLSTPIVFLSEFGVKMGLWQIEILTSWCLKWPKYKSRISKNFEKNLEKFSKIFFFQFFHIKLSGMATSDLFNRS